MVVPETEVIATLAGAEVWRRVITPGDYLIGRDPGCDLYLDVPTVAGEHARLTVYHLEIFLEDLGTESRTAVNGNPVHGSVRIWPGQKISIGAVQLELRRVKATAGAEESLAPQAAVVRQLLPPELLRDRKYDLGAVVAQGGMGAILAAHEATTDRTVAMKVMLQANTPESLVRFVAEARITAQLEHPSIVPVYELSVDEHDHVFYTMKYVRGVTLREVLRRLAENDPPTQVKYPLFALLTAFQKVCDAIAFAHSRGVLHRDLKPDNVMLGDYGEVLVMDWGVAKQKDEGGRMKAEVARGCAEGSDGAAVGPSSSSFILHPSSLTLPGTILGTPQYMSPEQARGETEQLDERSDIYALGAILYSILTLRPPVEGTDATEVMGKVARGEIAPISTARRSGSLQGAAAKRRTWKSLRWKKGQPGVSPSATAVPESLAAVAMKAMAARPDDRYASVADLQGDVTAFQNGFATMAERAGFLKQIALALRRHRRVAAVLAAALLLLLGVSALFTTRLVRERNRAEAGENLATVERNNSEQTLTRLQLQRAEELFAADDDSGGLAYLAHVLRRQPDDRATAERLLSALRDRGHLRPVLDLPRQEGAINSLDWSPDGTLLLTHCKNLVRIWDGADGRLRVGPVQIAEANRMVRFSPDGRRFVAVGTDSQVFDAQTGAAVTPLLVHAGRYDGQPVGQRNAVFAPDGKTIVTTTRHDFVNVWEVETGRKIRSETFVHRDTPVRRDLGGTIMPISSVFSADGAFHVIGRADGQMVLWETATWQTMQVLGDLQTFTASPAFSPDSRRLYFTQRGAITGIEVPSLQPLSWKIEPASPLVAYVVHPNGLELAVATADRQVRFYDTTDGRERSGSLVHTRDVVRLEYSQDGSRLVTRTDPSGIELWDAVSHRPLAARCPIRGDVMDFSLDRSGQRLAVATSDGSVRVWQIAPSEALPVILPVRADAERPAPEGVILHPNGKFLATLCRQTAQVWDWDTGERAGPVLNHETEISSIAFTPRGDRLLTGGREDKQVRVWDHLAGREVGPRMSSLGYVFLSFPTAGGSVCVKGDSVCMWNLATGRETPRDMGQYVHGARISPDGRRLAVFTGPEGTRKWMGRIFDPETGRQVGADAIHTGSVIAHSISPDSRTVATGADDGTVRVWSLADAAPLSSWLPHLAAVKQVEFSPDSRRLLTVSADRLVTVWDWQRGARVGVPIRQPATVHRAAFSPDGMRIATAAADDSVRLWESATGRPLSAGLALLARGANRWTRLIWTPDGRHLSTPMRGALRRRSSSPGQGSAIGRRASARRAASRSTR